MEPIVLPIDDVLDLHTFQPREVPELIDDYVTACVDRGILEVRIIHGKGSGILRERVHHILRRHRLVARFEAAAPAAGGWGATVVRLRPAAPPEGEPQTDAARERGITQGSPSLQAERSIPPAKGSRPMADAQEPTHGGTEWESRRLCRDESCIGIIGPDGRCKECGLPAGDKDPDAGAERSAARPAADSACEPVAAPATGRRENAAESLAPADSRDHYWRERQLCPDGNCIGVIGPDGRCKECGRRAEAGDPADSPASSD